MIYFIKPSPLLDHPVIKSGWGNGYVVIPYGHFLHGKTYDEIHELCPDLEVNGGLTLSQMVCALPWMETALLPPYDWVVGFDTAHAWDTPEAWPEERVLEETEHLRDQLLKVKAPIKKPQ